MQTTTASSPYKGFRFPQEIISHAVWLYFSFSLSYRDVEELLAERGIGVSYETVRQWCRKFGQQYANQLRCRRAKPGDQWFLDGVFLTINGKMYYLWRAVEQEGNVLDILVQRRARQQTLEFKQQYAKRAGIEGTISQGVRRSDVRRARYIGLAKTRLQHLMTAVALNLVRIVAWLQEQPRAQTRTSRFAAFAQTLAWKWLC